MHLVLLIFVAPLDDLLLSLFTLSLRESSPDELLLNPIVIVGANKSYDLLLVHPMSLKQVVFFVLVNKEICK